MVPFFSLLTSIKDYVEVVHKFVETDSSFSLNSYYDFGSVFTFSLLLGKEFLQKFFTFQWFDNFWSIPTIVPNIASSIISEISVFDNSLNNSQTFVESPFSYGNQNFFLYSLEKFMIGFLNSLFLCFPTSVSHIITLRRFVMQGLEAGFLSGLGTIVGNLFWIGSILFGFRFVVIPWLSLDLFRYFLGFLLLVKYMWESSKEKRMVVEDFSKYKIFFLTFLLSFTEQSTLSPFITNLSFGSDSTLLESFPTENFSQFTFVHCCYFLGLLLGSLSFLQFTCWFWENPAFEIYMWFLSSFQIQKTISSKFVNFFFLYLTMICALSNFSYFGLDYTLTNPLGFVHEDRLFEQKALLETSFLNSKASDRNTRRNRGRHGRRERWKRRIRKYRTFDASMYDQGIYDLFTIEDLNYGFDRFWLRRKLRNHRVRFRFFPGPWMRNFKKQLSRPRLESFLGPRVEFFRILFEQAYHPEFHEFSSSSSFSKKKSKNNESYFSGVFSKEKTQQTKLESASLNETPQFLENENFISWNIQGSKKERILKEHSAFRKFTRKVQTRLKKAKIESEIQNPQNFQLAFENSKTFFQPLSSKNWKTFAGIQRQKDKKQDSFSFQSFWKKNEKTFDFQPKNTNLKYDMSKKELFLQRYKNFLQSSGKDKISNSSFQKEKIAKKTSSPESFQSGERKTLLFSSADFPSSSLISTEEKLKENFPGKRMSFESTEKKKVKTFENLQNESLYKPMTFFQPLQFSFQKEQALKRKFQFYGVKLFRNYGVGNNAPYFRVLMKRFFYHYKPTLRWERTFRVASTRRARRKSSRIPKKLNIDKSTQILSNSTNFSKTSEMFEKETETQKPSLSSWKLNDVNPPTHFYSLVDKRASRYRFQIYKDVLQHWYYSPFNRLLLKLDVDSFLRRQPNSYFLTQNDEKFLHFKRQLLSEYYESLRWYTSMENYSTMKNQIGGTKTLSSRAYNQQFAGTLKKIRHLFNISPSFRESPVLKFDQPLYNEYSTFSLKGKNELEKSNGNAFVDSLLHEELFSENKDDFQKELNLSKTMSLSKTETKAKNDEKKKTDFSASLFLQTEKKGNLIDDSLLILRDSLTTAQPLREKYIESLLKEKNFWELSQFLFRGQKVRGTRPVANEKDFLNQEKTFFLESDQQKKYGNSQRGQSPMNVSYEFDDDIWISFFKKCQKKLYDQEALKNYVFLKKEKYEIQKQRHEKYLKNRVERMKDAIFQNEKISKIAFENFENFESSPSSFKKAVKESLLWEKNSVSNSSFETSDKMFGGNEFSYGKKLRFEKTNIRNNQFPMSSFFTKQKKEKLNMQKNFQNKLHLTFSQPKNPKTKDFVFSKNLHYVLKKQAIQILKAEKEVQEKFATSQKKSRILQFPLFQSFIEKTKKILFAFRSPFFPKAFSEGKKMGSQNENFEFQTQNEKTFEKKNIEFWKKRENVLSKRKKLRKTFKRLRNQNTQREKILFENNDFFLPFSEQKNPKTSDGFAEQNRQKNEKNSANSWQKYLGSFSSSEEKLQSQTSKRTLSSFFGFSDKNFQRKRTRLRRYSSLKGRGPIKKRSLREKLKRQFKSLKKYGKNQNTFSSEKREERENKKVELIQFITQRNSEPNGKFLKREEKQRRTRQMKERTWKKKKQNFAQKKRKLRKRRRSTAAKIRVYNKKIFRILSRKELQTWWWKIFFPHFQKVTEKTWQLEKNRQIQKELSDLSEKDIFDRDQTKKSFSLSGNHGENSFDSLQIGNKDFKPFALLSLVEKQKNFENSQIPEKILEISQSEKDENQEFNPDIFQKINSSLFQTENKMSNLSNSFLVPTTPLPFYAGWDTSLRKFVLTNRFLARKDCFSSQSNSQHGDKNFQEKFEFQQSPLQGMNAATTLYWQIPFTTYDPDQFFALGMDGFSPLGWRNFSLKHSKQTTKPILLKNLYSFDLQSSEQGENFSFFRTKNLQKNALSLDLRFKLSQQTFSFAKTKTEIDKNFEYRRILKKQKRLKKHPRPPVWFPSGSLSQQVLPVHYIYVFYKRSRLPRDRYIRRRLRSTFSQNQNSQKENQNTRILDFTLRKRTKARRKYHRKRFGDMSEKNQFFARRRKFRDFVPSDVESVPSKNTQDETKMSKNEDERSRPSSFFASGIKEEKPLFRAKKRRKIQDSKQPNENIRIRQLRRRVQRQVYRPVWRSRPRSGGFVWPGDYLRLELVKASPLKSTLFEKNETGVVENSQTSTRKIRKKNRRTLQEWQIQPKRYLFEKHNLKVLKKRIEKSMTSNFR